jgi:hypothetical protein
MRKTSVFVSISVWVAVIAASMFCSRGYGAEPAREYYEDGQLKSEKFYENGKEEGPFKNYSESGELESEGTYKDGKLDGPYKSYFEGGLLKSEITYKDGETEGSQYYDEDGQFVDPPKPPEGPGVNDSQEEQGREDKRAFEQSSGKNSTPQVVKRDPHRMPRWRVV